MKKYFKINDTDFGVDSVNIDIHESNKTVSITVIGNKSVTENLIQTDEKWSWLLSAPKFQLSEVPYTDAVKHKLIEIDESVLDNFDISLYLLEHNDVVGTLKITNSGHIEFSGSVFLNGKQESLRISA